MADKILKSRIVHKHDIEANWLLAANFVPMKGEIIVYDIEVDSDGNTLTLPSGRTEPYAYERIKVGDGIHNVNDLPFAVDAALALSKANWNQSDPSAPDYVKNRTHYTEKAFEDITWDGDTEGRDIGYLNDKNCFCKVSDQILTVEDLVGSKIINEIGTEIILKESDVVQATEDIIRIYSSAAVVVSTPTTYMGVAFPSAGVYSLLNTSLSTPSYTSAFIAKETVHKLDEKYIPDEIARVAQIDEVKNEVDELSSFVGDTTVSEQINAALDSSKSDWNQTNEAAFDYIKNKPLIATDADTLDFLSEMSYVTPVANADGSIYANEQGQVYTI